ncbi:MAG: patatin-like phospholipase family protein [Paludibacteraceae bacterium]|nr:patatin-like phospholipase family protein [Paludibacteraceae bacterium]
MTNAQQTPKIGICLSGGAALGYAHIGVLQALLEYGIHPDVIAGSSMGAIVGVLYAQNIMPERMLQIVRDEKIYKIRTLIDFTFSKRGISSHKALKHLLKDLVPTNSFDSLKKEYYVCVSNINKANWSIKGSGDKLHEYIVASASIPFIYEAVKIGDSVYVDGGLFNNLPAQALKGKCDIIIGVDVLPYFKRQEIKSTNEMLMLSIRGVEHHNSLPGIQLCDYLIEPPAVKQYNELSFDKFEEISKIGYETTIQYINDHPEIKNLAKK